MPINKQVLTPNGLTVSVHRVQKVEIGPGSEPGAMVVTVCSWSSLDSYLQGNSHAWAWPLSVPTACLSSDPFDAIERALTEDGPFEGGMLTNLPNGDSLESVKARKHAEINVWWLSANRSFFTFAGKEIDCDDIGRSNIDGMNAEVALNGVLPVDFPGVWKCRDNTYIAIPDVATWKLFVRAMVAQGTANFIRAQALKAMVQAATEIQEVQAISWATDISSFTMPAP
jgi:hypothetical protein